MSHSILCLNCDNPTLGKFCSNCGQKTDTHKITLKHFITHDILHGVWHFERGIFFTLKEAILRPGKAALDYISGKRIKYYNVFYLSLLIIGLNILLLHFYHQFKIQHTIIHKDDDTPNVTKFFADNVKIILFSIVPLLSVNAYLIFRRLKLNIAEHFIIAGMCLLGMLLLAIPFNLMNFMNEKFDPPFLGIAEVVTFFLIPVFPIWTYANAIKNKYTFLGAVWRVLLFEILVLIEILILLSIIILNITNGRQDFYINI